MKVFMRCNEGHDEEWMSSPDIKAGRGSIPLINLMIVCYSLFSGLHWNQFKVIGETLITTFKLLYYLAGLLWEVGSSDVLFSYLL